MKMTEKKKCLKDLELNYSNPSHPISFAGISAIRRHYKNILSVAEIESFLSKNKHYIRYKEAKKPKVRNPTYAYHKLYQLQLDLIEILNVKKVNGNYGYILSCIDTFSRKGYLRLLKRKTAEEFLEGFKSILNECGGNPYSVASDRGKEMDNHKFRRLCLERNIKVIFCDTSVHAAVVERFNGTIQKRIYKWCAANNTLSFYTHLREILDGYNAAHHRTINCSPNFANREENAWFVRMNQEKVYSKVKRVKKVKFRPGQIVQISLQKNKLYSRGYSPKFSNEQFIVHKVHQRLPIPLYELSDGKQVLKGLFYGSEITASEHNQDL